VRGILMFEIKSLNGYSQVIYLFFIRVLFYFQTSRLILSDDLPSPTLYVKLNCIRLTKVLAARGVLAYIHPTLVQVVAGLLEFIKGKRVD